MLADVHVCTCVVTISGACGGGSDHDCCQKKGPQAYSFIKDFMSCEQQKKAQMFDTNRLDKILPNQDTPKSQGEEGELNVKGISKCCLCFLPPPRCL